MHKNVNSIAKPSAAYKTTTPTGYKVGGGKVSIKGPNHSDGPLKLKRGR